MQSDDIDLLDRRFAFLEGLDGGAFVRELARMLEVLEADTRFAAHLSDLGREAEEVVRQFERDDARFVGEAVSLRDRLISFAPDSDDSNQPPPGNDEFDPSTFAWFKQRLGGPAFPPDTFEVKGETKAQELLSCVKAKAEGAQIADSPAARRFGDDLRAALRDLKRCEAKFVDWKLTSPAVSLAAIRNLVFNSLDTEGLSFEDGPWVTTFGFSVGLECGLPDFDLRKPDPGPDTKVGRQLAREVAVHRLHAKRVHEELRLRVGSRASMLALFERFKHRSEWHDRLRLAHLAGPGAPGEKARRREDVLTAELARWLFDNGLNPLSTPVMADLRPDLVDPTQRFNLYVEAKQYGSSARKYLIKGFRQVWDTVSGIQASPYRVREAFFVIFRRSGPRYVLPKLVACEGWTTHIIVIDIASTQQRGSRGAPKVEHITEAELLGSRGPDKQRRRSARKKKGSDRRRRKPASQGGRAKAG